MSKKFKASIERGNPPIGIVKCVVSLKDAGGGRWEFVGSVPLAAARTMMALSSSQGARSSLGKGTDSGIEQAFAKGGTA